MYRKLYYTGTSTSGPEISSDNVDALKRGIGNLRLWRYCQRLHKILGLPKIERYELFAPTRDSFYRIISSLVIYLRFREALNGLYHTLISHLDQLAESELSNRHNINTIGAELTKFKQLHTDCMQDSGVFEEKKKLESKLLQAQEAFNTHRERQSQLTANVGRVSLELNNVLLERTKARRQAEQLSLHIAADPKELQEQIDSLQAELERSSDELERSKIASTYFQARVQLLTQSTSVAQQIKSNISEHFERVIKQTLEDQTQCQTLQVDRDQLALEIERQTIKRNGARNDLAELREKHQNRMRTIQQQADAKLARAREFAHESETYCKALEEKITTGTETLSSLEAQLQAHGANLRIILSQLDSKFSPVLDAANKYANNLANMPLV
ncbi:bifunctional Nuf2 [Babesia duncani]|uniref:Bifunctional Nuf2 n=1 Tax=Babesia duncani TaxID=323732 RepID=A0AAD9UMV2_9APIC|nr:bifunctional Nuf2 [Babesia duncani]